MSPFNTFNSWGNSSIDNFLIIFPTLVILGSFLNFLLTRYSKAKTSSLLKIFCKISSALSTILLNLYNLNNFPFKPILSWVNIAFPLESSFIAIIVIKNKGNNTIIPIKLAKISKVLLITKYAFLDKVNLVSITISALCISILLHTRFPFCCWVLYPIS